MIECPQCEAQMRSSKCACGYKVETRPDRRIFKPTKDQRTARPGLVRACRALLEKRWNNKITSFELSEAMFELEKEYPGAGFHKIARNILEEWEKREGQR